MNASLTPMGEIIAARCNPAFLESLPAFWRGMAASREAYATQLNSRGLDTDALKHFRIAASYEAKAEELASKQ